MSSPPPLPDALNFGLVSDIRFWSFDRLVEHVEEFVSHAKDQTLVRRQHELSVAQPRDIQELEGELELVTFEWSSKYPAHFFGSLIVLLSGEIEIVIGNFATQVKEVKGLLLALEDIAGPSPYSRLRKYVQVALSADMPENSIVEDLYFLRNLFAHHGGDLSSQSEKRLRRVEAITRASPGVTLVDGYVVVQPVYLFAASAAASSLARLLSSLHPGR